MKIKRDQIKLGFENSKGKDLPLSITESRPDLRSKAAKRMSRPSKLAILERGREKLSTFYSARGLHVF